MAQHSVSDQAAQLVRGAWKIVFQNGRWTRGTLARDAAGRPVSYNSILASAWDFQGAIYCLAYRWKYDRAAEYAARQAMEAALGQHIGVANDTCQSHAQFIERFRPAVCAAIARLEGELR